MRNGPRGATGRVGAKHVTLSAPSSRQKPTGPCARSRRAASATSALTRVRCICPDLWRGIVRTSPSTLPLAMKCSNSVVCQPHVPSTFRASWYLQGILVRRLRMSLRLQEVLLGHHLAPPRLRRLRLRDGEVVQGRILVGGQPVHPTLLITEAVLAQVAVEGLDDRDLRSPALRSIQGLQDPLDAQLAQVYRAEHPLPPGQVHLLLVDPLRAVLLLVPAPREELGGRLRVQQDGERVRRSAGER